MRHQKWPFLIVLAMGLLSMELDLLRDHARADAVSCKYCAFGDGQRALHLVRNELNKEQPPCNACFFHNLLANGLVPIQGHLTLPTPLIQTSRMQFFWLAQPFSLHKIIRGPPLS